MVEVKVASSVDEHSLLGEPDMYGIQRFGPYADPQQLVPISKGGKKPEALNSMTLQVRLIQRTDVPGPATPRPHLPAVPDCFVLCWQVAMQGWGTALGWSSAQAAHPRIRQPLAPPQPTLKPQTLHLLAGRPIPAQRDKLEQRDQCWRH